MKKAWENLIKHIPEPWKNTEIQLIGGGELIATHIQGTKDKIKTARCNHCGLCCVDFPTTIYGDDDEGKCNALQLNRNNEWICTVWNDRPVSCIADPMNIGECSIRY